MAQKEAYLFFENMINTKGKRQLHQINIAKIIQEIILLFSCFIVGRAVIFNDMAPFGVALFAVILNKRLGGLPAFIAISAGLLSYDFGPHSIEYIAAMFIIWLFKYFSEKSKTDIVKKGISLPYITLLSVLALNIVSSFFNHFLLLDIITGILESVIAFILIFVFSKVADVFIEHKKRRILSGEEIICISIFLAIFIIGFWDIEVFNISLRNIFAVFLILLSAYIGGAGVGASIGITIGFILSFAGSPDPVLIANLAVCGLIAGTFNQLGKISSGLAFLLANSLMTFYVNYSTFVIIPFTSIVISTVLLLLVPQKGIVYLKQFLDYTFVRTKEQHYYVKRMQELTVGRLKEFSQVFHQLSRAFGNMSDKKQQPGHEEISRLFEFVVDEVCSKCIFYKSCWQRDFNTTYTGMFEMLTVCESEGVLNTDNMPGDFKKRCLEPGKLTSTLNSVYNTLKTNLQWQDKIHDCRQLVAEQLEGVSRVVHDLASEIDMDIRFKNDIEYQIRVQLDKEGIRTGEVLVFEKPGGTLEVSVSKIPCRGGRECLNIVDTVVSDVLGKPMTCNNKNCIYDGKDMCILRLNEARQYEVITGVSRKKKDNSLACGDSYSFLPVKDGKYMLALSDGMGSGVRAAEESNAVITLLENFLEAGFGQDIAIKTINSILILRSRDEMYATADICILDLVNGSADFIKIGGVSAFIRRKDKVEVIEEPTLPIGILEEMKLETITTTIEDEDMIIMMTDGVLDAFNRVSGGRDYLLELINGFRTSNPQELSDCIMEQALNYSEGKAEDDMTVMVARVWEARGLC